MQLLLRAGRLDCSILSPPGFWYRYWLSLPHPCAICKGVDFSGGYVAPRSRNIGETRGTPLHLYVPETGVPHVSLFLRHPSAPLRAGSGRGHFECSLVTDRSFGFFYSPFMTEGLHRIYGGNDLHFVTFSCYRRRPLFRNEARCDLFLKILDPVRRRYRFVVLGYVVMPEHVHLLVSEPQRETLSTAIQALKIGFVRSFQCSGGSVVAVAPRSRNIGETRGTPLHLYIPETGVAPCLTVFATPFGSA